MQRVAIARALINDPEIILADEPTGALDSTTSIQIMEILKEISKDKLIIMVTHNPDIANEYSTRVVKLLDGVITDDTNPYKQDETAPVVRDTKKKKSMSLFTALALSLTNLLTKKGRTFLTAFAGSIGIIGIALILSVSTGVNAYIKSVEEGTMSSYPLEIRENTTDTMALLNSLQKNTKKEDKEPNTIYSNDVMVNVMNAFSNESRKNNLTDFKKYIETDPTIAENSTDIKYIYKASLNPYTIIKNEDGTVSYRKNLSTIMDLMGEIGFSNDSYSNSSASTASSFMGGAWSELVGNDEYIKSQYNLVAGEFPKNENEIVLIVGDELLISDYILYSIGFRDIQELKNYIQTRTDSIENNDAEISSTKYTFDEILNYEFKVIPDSEKYKIEDGKIVKKSSTEIYNTLNSDAATTLKIVGIITPTEDTLSSTMMGSIGYTAPLMAKLIQQSNNSDVVKLQESNTTTNLLTGIDFELDLDFTNIKNKFIALAQMVPEYKSYASYIQKMTDKQMLDTLYALLLDSNIDDIVYATPYGGYKLENAAELKTYLSSSSNPATSLITSEDDSNFINILNAMYNNDKDYEDVLSTVGYVNKDKPSSILIYPKDFDSKDKITSAIETYNSTKENKEDKITYTDTIALLLNSVTTIINAVSYVLVAFVAISLIVSSIMIGIITYISVLERTKEIGILRAIGASKKDISRVFNAETLIVGFAAGVIGIIVSLFFIVIINIILHALTGLATLSATLPVLAAVILVAISMTLTLIAGIIPSRIASKKDPVIALRTE